MRNKGKGSNAAIAGKEDKLRVVSERKGFTLVYNDFLESQLLDCYEKMVFIAIKRFANNETLVAFPSLNRLHQMTGISKSKIQTVIASLEQKGVLKIEHRMDVKKGHRSNEYILYDFAGTWTETEEEEIGGISDQRETQRMINLLEAKGYTVTKVKEKEPVSVQPTKATDSDPKQLKQLDIVNTTLKQEECQDPEVLEEEYSQDAIREYYDYNILVNDNPELKRDIESVMSILYDTLNGKKPTIRIDGEDKPRMVVVSRLLKIGYMDIRYAIRKYTEQTDRIVNPRGYMLTILYHAAEQGHLDVANQVTHDMVKNSKN